MSPTIRDLSDTIFQANSNSYKLSENVLPEKPIKVTGHQLSALYFLLAYEEEKR